MVTGDLDYKHFFVVNNEEISYDNKEMLSFFIKRLEGKRGYMLIREYEEEKTPNQLAFYFAGIIKAECMNSECFAGLSSKEIHQVLFEELRSKQIIIEMPDGSSRIKTVSEDFGGYGIKKMKLYIDELIIHLLVNYKIQVKDPKMYKGYNKMVLRQKTVNTGFTPGSTPEIPDHLKEGW